ncbi:hypothetical protein Bca52824_004219 [Brassica carinata]|uniref:Uncharacterized protein n=1 Tax=Brassica carinata TaxID=52824 RepID=A0A8X8BC56_BRACI|nr:hypothetical protein Bca52824_004219 [Brassica carinata]
MAATDTGTAHFNQTWDLSCNLDVNFETEEHAFIAYRALAVDKEVRRVMSVSNNKLKSHFEARLHRASFSAFVDILTLATRTIQESGQN